jgi:hypothetical protein
VVGATSLEACHAIDAELISLCSGQIGRSLPMFLDPTKPGKGGDSETVLHIEFFCRLLTSECG